MARGCGFTSHLADFENKRNLGTRGINELSAQPVFYSPSPFNSSHKPPPPPRARHPCSPSARQKQNRRRHLLHLRPFRKIRPRRKTRPVHRRIHHAGQNRVHPDPLPRQLSSARLSVNDTHLAALLIVYATIPAAPVTPAFAATFTIRPPFPPLRICRTASRQLKNVVTAFISIIFQKIPPSPRLLNRPHRKSPRLPHAPTPTTRPPPQKTAAPPPPPSNPPHSQTPTFPAPTGGAAPPSPPHAPAPRTTPLPATTPSTTAFPKRAPSLPSPPLSDPQIASP